MRPGVLVCWRPAWLSPWTRAQSPPTDGHTRADTNIQTHRHTDADKGTGTVPADGSPHRPQYKHTNTQTRARSPPTDGHTGAYTNTQTHRHHRRAQIQTQKNTDTTDRNTYKHTHTAAAAHRQILTMNTSRTQTHRLFDQYKQTDTSRKMLKTRS